jgi:nitrate reductase cytochrome c-type subunit
MALHNWLRRKKEKTGRCDECGEISRKTDWANISGEYLRDLSDYRELCRGCHVAQDRERDPLTGRFL